MEFVEEGKSASSGIRTPDRPGRGLATVRTVHMDFAF
jgi:hypothetical protein